MGRKLDMVMLSSKVYATEGGKDKRLVVRGSAARTMEAANGEPVLRFHFPL
jgi:hypothetical protein